ncbi:MAG: DUF3859 domain-containing protein [Steroidobacteraceae bacterium]
MVLAASLPLFSGAALAQEVTVTGATITGYGNYLIGKDVKNPYPNNPSITAHVSSQLTPPTTNSDQIKLAANTSFGFGYVLSGRPANGLITLRHVRKLPPPGMPNVKTGQPDLYIETPVRATIDGKDLFVGWTFDGDEVAHTPTGPWTLQVWYGDRLLLEKSFNVVLKQ